MDHAVRTVLVVALAAGCGGDPTFRCESNEQCALDGVDGVCEATHYCSFVDATCEGRRYADSAGDDLAGRCLHVAVFGDVPQTTRQGVTTDAELESAAPTTNRGSVDNLTIDASMVVSVLRIELESLPTTAIVEHAELHAHVIETGDLSVEIHALGESWDEATVTWEQRTTGVAWSSPGAGAQSRTGAQLGAFSAAALGPVNATLDSATVQSWVSSPATNFGCVLVTRSLEGATIASTQEGDAAQRPYLVVTWR